MKPAPDESSEIEPPMTRALFATDVDINQGRMPTHSEETLDGDTRRGVPASDPTDSKDGGPRTGQVTDWQTSWSDGSEIARPPSMTSLRGGGGRIEPGQTLYSKYLVLRKLGGGAMGDVWLVRHAMLKSEHALKVIVPNFATNALALMRFQREFEIMATLRHEHAVTIYDACIDADGGYIDMEYVEGKTIHEVLGMARGRDGLDPAAPLMPLDWIVRVLDQLCEVLEVAHNKGIVHRDLKPSNMMLLGGRPPGREYLKVLDFGIAKIRDDPEGVAGRDQEAAENKTQGFIGTPSYGSPEQALGVEEVDGRADLYSVGIMLYEFVTGRLPFRGNHWQVMSQNANSPPPPFYETNPHLRPLPELEHAIFRVLSKNREERPQSARQLYEEIREAVEAILPAGSPGLPPHTWVGFPDHSSHSSIAPPLSTEHDRFGGEPLPTQADTLVAKAKQNWKSESAVERPSDLGQPVGRDGADRPRKTLAKPLTILIAATVGSALLVGLLLIAFMKRNRAEPKDPVSANPGGTPVVRKKSIDFESYWPNTYRPVEGYSQGMPWPEKVRRTTDEAVFLRFGDGIYIPETFEPDMKAGLATDGWPKVIVKNGIRFLRMPGDTWIMGAWDDPNAVDRADAPAHPVTLTGYYLQETEVTHGQVEDYLTKEDKSPPTDWERAFNRLKTLGPDVARRYPASNISRELAQRFARWMGGQLPTEAQWEYAARSLGQKRRYVWGDGPSPDRNMARIDANDATPSPVGSYAKTADGPGKDQTEQGVLDMAGNLQEMCRDAWVSSYIKSDAALIDPSISTNEPERALYSIRGGYYGSIGKDCATTRRDDKLAAAELAENIGFRLVVECPDARKSR